jgi:hypothetical protein
MTDPPRRKHVDNQVRSRIIMKVRRHVFYLLPERRDHLMTDLANAVVVVRLGKAAAGTRIAGF